jgi:hypothetical protein
MKEGIRQVLQHCEVDLVAQGVWVATVSCDREGKVPEQTCSCKVGAELTARPSCQPAKPEKPV